MVTIIIRLILCSCIETTELIFHKAEPSHPVTVYTVFTKQLTLVHVLLCVYLKKKYILLFCVIYLHWLCSYS